MKRKMIVLTALLIAVLLCTVTALAEARELVNAPPEAEFTAAELEEISSGVNPDLVCSIIANKIIAKTNGQRAAAGRVLLSKSADLMTKAQTWSNHIAADGDVSHHYLAPGVLGQNNGNMLPGNVNFFCSGGLHVVPNTEKGIAKFMVHAWMAHDACVGNGHRKNILRASFRKIGVGVTFNSPYYYCVQDFA